MLVPDSIKTNSTVLLYQEISAILKNSISEHFLVRLQIQLKGNFPKFLNEVLFGRNLPTGQSFRNVVVSPAALLNGDYITGVLPVISKTFGKLIWIIFGRVSFQYSYFNINFSTPMKTLRKMFNRESLGNSPENVSNEIYLL